MSVVVFWCWCLFARIRQVQLWAECEVLFEHLRQKKFQLQPRTLRARWVFLGMIDGKSCRVVFQSTLQGHRLLLRYGTHKQTFQHITKPLHLDDVLSKLNV